MREKINWRCPHCGNNATVFAQKTRERVWQQTFLPNRGFQEGDYGLASSAIVCPNDECEKLSLTTVVEVYQYRGSIAGLDWEEVQDFQLLPRSKAQSFPNYVPAVILQNYEEACLVLADSANASAALSRRCLQGMIHERFDIKMNTLKAEIDALEEQLDPLVWQAIEAVRKLGNIGAHMDKDVNLIIDVKKEEAEQLIDLIEYLIQD